MDFDTFISVPRTALEYAQLEVPGYPVSKFRMREQLHKERVPRYQNQRRGGGYVYCFHELPKKWQEDIINHFQTLNQNEIEIHQKTSSKELDSIIYAAAPEYNKRKADKYLALYNDYAHLKGNALKDAIEKYNQEQPEQKASYSRVKAAFKEYEQSGIVAFLGKYGKNLKNTTVPDDAFEHWKGLIGRRTLIPYEAFPMFSAGRCF